MHRSSGGYSSWDLGLPLEWDVPPDKAVEELRSLMEIINPDLFRAKKRCIVNPRFASPIILADADLLIDDRLIDIKVVKSPYQDRQHWDQLFGYYALHRSCGIAGLNRNVRIRGLGIYSARYASYQQVDLVGEQLVRAERLSEWINARIEKIAEKWRTNGVRINERTRRRAQSVSPSTLMRRV